MLFIQKKGFNIKNGRLEKQYNIQMKKTNKGYNIVGYDNDKIINKHVLFRNKTLNKPMNNKPMNKSMNNNPTKKVNKKKRKTNKKK
jgi:hypothetical protein